MENDELNRIRRGLESVLILKKRREALINRINEVKQLIIELLSEIEKKQHDEKIVDIASFSNILFNLVGNYQRKINRHERQLIELKLKYTKEKEHLKILEEELRDLEEDITQLSQDTRSYSKHYIRKVDEISKVLPEAIRIKYLALEEKRKALVEKQIGMLAAYKIVEHIMDNINSIQKSLDSATKWVDSGAFVNKSTSDTDIKYTHLDTMAYEFAQLASRLRDLKEDLKDLGHFNTLIGIGIDNSIRIVDYWFDNLFTDLKVRDKITEDQQQINSLAYYVEKILLDLDGQLKILEINLSGIESMQQELR